MNPAIFLYNFLLLIFTPLIFLFLLLSGLKKNRLEGLRKRLNPFPGVSASVTQGSKRFWVHAASVGEVKVARTLICGIHGRFPRSEVYLSTFTLSGLKEATKIGSVKAVSILPPDIPFLIRKLIKRVRPGFFISVESEFWPNLFNELKKTGITSILVNGRVSERSFKRYGKIRFFLKRVLASLDLACMRNSADAERIIALGLPGNRALITGNMKFDCVLSEFAKTSGPKKETIAGYPMGVKIVVLGNTRNGEEKLLIPTVKKITGALGATVIIAPRHIERIEEIEGLLAREKIGSIRWSNLMNGGKELKPRVILFDIMGKLFSLYENCVAAFIGGSLLPFGGQNVLEPAVFGKPVFFGKNMKNFQEEARILKESGGGIEVEDAEDLCVRLSEVLENPGEAQRIGRAAKNAVNANAGALDKCLNELERFME